MNKRSHRDDEARPAGRRRDWRRVHHSPLFWVGVALFLLAAAVYVLSDDLAWRPRLHGPAGSRVGVRAPPAPIARDG
ncbi:MAG: hypothetical protein ABR970_03565 [Roseiarcus sp.]